MVRTLSHSTYILYKQARELSHGISHGKTYRSEILNEYFTHQSLPLLSSISTESSSKKIYLAKIHTTALVWKSKEKLLQQATNTLAKVWHRVPLLL